MVIKNVSLPWFVLCFVEDINYIQLSVYCTKLVLMIWGYGDIMSGWLDDSIVKALVDTQWNHGNWFSCLVFMLH